MSLGLVGCGGTGDSAGVAPAAGACRSVRTGGGLLFETRYGSRLGAHALQACWHIVQLPRDHSGRPAAGRMRLVAPPGAASDRLRPHSSVMRVELRPYDDAATAARDDGDVTDTGGYRANRAEVLDRDASRATPAARWPDPVGSVRWYSLSLFVPRTFGESRSKWLDIVQWKGLNSGSPAIAVGVDGPDLVLSGKHVHGRLAHLTKGRWMRIVVGIGFSTDARRGWVAVVVDGRTVVRKKPAATMNLATHDGRAVVDPSYFKEGIYRSDAWKGTHVLYFGTTRVGTTRAAVG